MPRLYGGQVFLNASWPTADCRMPTAVLQLLHRDGLHAHTISIQQQGILLRKMPGIENVGFAQM